MRAWIMLGVAACLFAGCKVETGDDEGGNGPSTPRLPDLDEIEDAIRDAAANAGEIEICPGSTVEELLQANSLTPECRDALLSFLPDPESSFESRLLSPGGARVVDGELRVLLQGVDADGAALSASALAAAEVRLVVGGEAQLLAEGEYEATLSADLPTDLVSLSVVNDYSASMTTGDLRDVEALERALFECLPPVHETEVIRFSTEVDTLLPFTSDAAEIDAALALDDGFERQTTALLDALGTAATDLAARERPVRILVLSSDGRENASSMFEQPEVLRALDDNQVFVVTFAALLADVDFIRELSEGRGVFAYTREFSALQGAAMPYLESLKELVELRIPMTDPPPDAVRVTLDTLELELAVEVELAADAGL